MGIVSAIPEKCKRCYACVRECPAKAIKVEGGQALVIEERCIACGNCVKVCAQNAKRIEDSTEEVRTILARGKKKVACLAPSFPAAFIDATPGKVISAIRRLGFDEVWSVAFGAELVARQYPKFFEQARLTGAPVIASPCPALVSYVEKYMPSLRGALAPIVSPMIAVARAIRYRHGSEVSVVFIGPCIAKKNEIRDPYVVGHVDSVLTFRELVSMFENAGIAIDEMDDGDFDGPRSLVGGSFPISGGLLRTAGVIPDVLDNEIVVAEGKERALKVLDELAEGKSNALLFDVLFCEGCISGPRMLNDLGTYARKEILANYVNQERERGNAPEFKEQLRHFEPVHLERAFTPQNVLLPDPTEEQVAEALRAMGKLVPEDQLNCGACGYPTCREKAVAVCQKLAEASMCLPFLIDELERTCGQLKNSNQELEAAQHRLVQTERLASMGQLSAGIAHEINNPLGTVLIYSSMLLKQLAGHDDSTRDDLEMIVSEANRCKRIVRGLLDFARQSRVSKAPTDLSTIVLEVFEIMEKRAEERGIALEHDIPADLPVMMIDGDQVKQMMVNLVGNGIDSIHHERGWVAVRARHVPEEASVMIDVEDNGEGIPEEHLSKLFTPFFSTKELGAGTGLGLAICYGIVKMHSGNITVQSSMGKGTTFTVSLPIGTPSG